MHYRTRRHGEIIRIGALANREDLRMAVYVLVGREVDVDPPVGVLDLARPIVSAYNPRATVSIAKEGVRCPGCYLSARPRVPGAAGRSAISKSAVFRSKRST